MDKIKYVKIENEDGSLSDNIPIGAEAVNIETAGGGSNLEEDLEQIQIDITNIGNSLNQARNNIIKIQNDIEDIENPVADMDSAQLGTELITSSGWITTGWTGNYSTGFTHIVGETTPLEYPLSNTGSKKFQVSFDVVSPTPAGPPNASTAFSVVIGNSLPPVTYDGGGSKHYEFGIQSVENGNLKFILTRGDNPTITDGSFDGTIKNISVKEITTPYTAIQEYHDTNDRNSLEIRVSPKPYSNSYIGIDCGKYNTTGKGNVGIGVQSLENNTTGYWNTSLGYQCMINNTLGSRNVGIGYVALRDNTSGDRNYAIGTFALCRNTSGRTNVAIGADTLWCNTTGQGNVAIGSASQSEMVEHNYNTSIGQSSLSNATKGDNQVAIGYLALGNSPGGNYNIAIGRQALYKSDNDNNIGIGYASLGASTSGTQNVAVGHNALSFGKTVNYATAIGHCAGQNSTGNGNTIIGYRAGLNLTGNNNTMIGRSANENGTSNYNSICIGYNSSLPSTTAGYLMSLGNVIYGDLSKGLICINKDKNNLAFEAVLEIGASTNGAPPLKFTNQELVENPVPGAFEYYNNKLYFTLGNGVRKEIQLNNIA